MQISPITQFNFNKIEKPSIQPSFECRGKPITLEYIVEKRSYLLPERVLKMVKEELAKGVSKLPSLMEIHKSIYEPLLRCKTLEEAQSQEMFPEFKNIKNEVVFERNTRYAREFQERTDSSFALKMLQEFWANLKTKEQIAKELGMTSRTSLEWPLKQINFVSYPANYKTLLLASDSEGNKKIASKTTAWNALHPDLMYARNKHAAQACKKESYRKAHSIRIKEYDKNHPERREKIALASKESWERCPEVRQAMAEFAKHESGYIKKIIMKRFKGEVLTKNELRTSKGFFKRFWQTYPELKSVFSKARKQN